MQDNQVNHIVSGLSNYIGSIINYEKDFLDPQSTKHDITAILMQEVLKLGKDQDGYDMYVLLPVFRSLKIILNERIKMINEDLKNVPTEVKISLQKTKDNYANCIDFVNELIKSLEKK